MPAGYTPPAAWHTRVPVEGAGVVHVVTDPDEAETDIILRRHQDGAVVECVHVHDCIGFPDSCDEMHMFWSDLETLTFCLRRTPIEQYYCKDEYMERKSQQLFGRSWY